jgi:hypothetical protein
MRHLIRSLLSGDYLEVPYASRLVQARVVNIQRLDTDLPLGRFHVNVTYRTNDGTEFTYRECQSRCGQVIIEQLRGA